MPDQVKIIFESDTKGITDAETALEKLSKTDKAAADQFKKSNDEYTKAFKTRQDAIEAEIKNIERLRIARKNTFNSDEIRNYNSEIIKSKNNIQVLGGQYSSVTKGSQDFLKQQVALNAALKQSTNAAGAATKAYGLLKTAANIIPGLGISGLILLGYETLVGLVGKLSESFGSTNKELIDSKKLLSDVTNELIKFHNETLNIIVDEQDLADEVKFAFGEITESQLKENKIQRQSDQDRIEQQRKFNQSRQKILSEYNDFAIKNKFELISKEEAAQIQADEHLLDRQTALNFRAESIRFKGDTKQAEALISLQNRLQDLAIENENAQIALEKSKNDKIIVARIESQKKQEELDDGAKKEGLKKIKERHDEELKLRQLFLSELLKNLRIANDKQIILSEDGSKDKLEAQIAAITEEQNFILETTVLTAQQRENIVAENENKILKLKTDFAQKQKEESLKLAKEQAEEEAKLREEQFEEDIKVAEEQADLELAQQQAFQDASFDISHETSNLISALNQASTNAELQEAQRKLDTKQITEEQFAEEVMRIKRNAAKQDKALNLFNIALNTAEGIIKYVSNPITAPFVPFVVATGAIQAGIVAATPIPFAKGTKSVKGGQQGKDSVHALLMPDEMVIPVDRKRKYEPILNAIFDERISPDLLNSMAAKGNMNFTQNNSIDEYVVSSGMKRALRDGIIVKNMPKNTGNISMLEYELLKRRGIA